MADDDHERHLRQLALDMGAQLQADSFTINYYSYIMCQCTRSRFRLLALL